MRGGVGELVAADGALGVGEAAVEGVVAGGGERWRAPECGVHTLGGAQAQLYWVRVRLTGGVAVLGFVGTRDTCVTSVGWAVENFSRSIMLLYVVGMLLKES
jgi:hypothetical protein